MSTPARISLGAAGPAVPTREQLRFAHDHALARDAVRAQLDVPSLLGALATLGLQGVAVRSAVQGSPDRRNYLRRPDLGRRLADASRAHLLSFPRAHEPTQPRLLLVLADGLSALAVERHALALLGALLPRIAGAWTLLPVLVAGDARVALGDDAGESLGADVSLILIGERPGLSSPDSLGAYLTWAPRTGRTDAERNCVSNIRGGGLSYDAAAERLAHLLAGARNLGATGVVLKDDAEPALPAPQ